MMPLLALLAAEAAPAPNMDLWKWLNFILLVGVLGWLIAKNVGPLLVARTKQIQDGLAAGVKAKAEADTRAAAVSAKLANLGDAIAEMKTSAKVEGAREADRIRTEMQAELVRMQQNAEREVESAGKLARLEVQRFAARMAIELAERKVRARMSPETQAALVDNFIGEISGAAAGPHRTN